MRNCLLHRCPDSFWHQQLSALSSLPAMMMQIMMMIDDEEEDDDEDEDEDHDDGEEEDQVYKRMTHSGVWLNVKSSCP